MFTFSKVWCYGANLYGFSTNKTDARLFIAVHTTQTWTQITVAQMGVC